MATTIARRLLGTRALSQPFREFGAARAAAFSTASNEGDSASDGSESESAQRRNAAGETSGQNTTHFGYRDVPVEEKKGLVADVFERVAPSYDVMNDLMSGGLHRLWKDQLVSTLRPGAGQVHLDVAGGTGDVAFRVLNTIRREERIQRLSGRRAADAAPGHVIVYDINPHMLAEGRKRAASSRFSVASEALDSVGNPTCGADLSFVEGDAERLPLADGSVDSFTIAFGLRNVTHPENALREAARVLRRGGRFLCLEFSHVELEPLRQLYDAYSFAVIPAIGRAVAGDAAPYQYLVESIRKFPRQEDLCDMMRDAGLSVVGYENMTAGVVAVHSGFKL